MIKLVVNVRIFEVVKNGVDNCDTKFYKFSVKLPRKLEDIRAKA